MKTFQLVFLSAVLLIAMPRLSGMSETEPVSSEVSERILNLIFSKGPEIYKKYRGVESIRKEHHQEFEPQTNALKSTSEITSHRKDYFYEQPEIEVLSLKKDGTDMNPSKHRIWKTMPIYPVFDEQGLENYELKITDKKKIDERECYRIQVIPRKETSRHFKGNIYCTVDKLETVFTEGTVAKLDFPLREFYMELRTMLINDVPVLQSGTVKVRVRVPIFYPDTLIVSTITVVECKLIEQNKKAR